MTFFTPVAGRVAWKFAKHFYDGRYHDLKAVGLLAVVVALRRVLAGRLTDDGIEKYVYRAIARSIKNHVDRDHTIRWPYSEVLRQHEASGEVQRPVMGGDLSEVVVDKSPVAALQLQESLERVLETDEDREIVNLLIAGYTQREIAHHLKRSRVSIQRRIDAIRDRYPQ